MKLQVILSMIGLKKYIKIKDEIKKVDWQFASKNVDNDFHTDIVFLRILGSSITKFAGKKHDSILLHYKNFTGKFYFSKKRTKILCNILIDKMLHNINWRK